MNTKYKTTLTALLLTAIGCGLSIPAESQELNNLLRSVLGGNRTYYEYDQGVTFAPPTAAQTQTMHNLDSRRLQLQGQISQAVSSGQMTRQQANTLQSNLNSNASLQNSYLADGSLSFAEAQSLLNVLSDIDTSVQASISAYPGYSVSTTTYYTDRSPGYRNWNRNSSTSSNIDSLQGEILNRMQLGQADGRLSRSEYFQLKREFDRIASIEIQLRSQGGFSLYEMNSVQARLDNLNASVTRQMEDGNSYRRFSSRSSYSVR